MPILALKALHFTYRVYLWISNGFDNKMRLLPQHHCSIGVAVEMQELNI
jgi:hypothetical protein